jgi:MFS family permease
MKANKVTSLEIDQYSKNIKLYYLYTFLKHFIFFGGVLIPFFTVWGEIKFSEVMILQTIFTISIFLFEIPTGALADHLGRKSSMILGGITTAGGFLLYTIVPNFYLFALGEVIIALGFSLTSGADQALLYDSLKKLKQEQKSKKIFARAQTICFTSGMIAAPLGSIIAKIFGLRTIMLFTAIPIFLSVIVAANLKEPKHQSNKNKETYTQKIKSGLKYFQRNKILKEITFDYVPIAALAFFLVWVYQIILQNLNISIELFGFVHAAIFAVEIILLANLSRVEKFFGGKKKYLKFSAIICGLGFISLAFITNAAVAIVVILVIAALGLTRKTIYINYLNKHIESKIRATVLSLISMIYALTQTLSNLIFGKMVDYNLHLTLFLVGTFILAFVFLSNLKEQNLLE